MSNKQPYSNLPSQPPFRRSLPNKLVIDDRKPGDYVGTILTTREQRRLPDRLSYVFSLHKRLGRITTLFFW